MMEKVCFKCGILKPLSDFYVHKRMGDGHLNKCKDCVKKDVKEKYIENVEVPGYTEKERKRGRKKYHRLYVGTGKTNPEAVKKWEQKYPEKNAAKKYATNKLVPKGFEGHHWSYNIEHVRDVISLTKKHHMKAHRFIVYDQEQMMYRRFDNNVLLDTKESHVAFIKHCIENMED